MKRRLFNLAAAASLVLCVATAALWVRSFFVGLGMEWGYDTAGNSLFMGCSRGKLFIGKTSISPASLQRHGFWFHSDRPVDLLDGLDSAQGPNTRRNFRFLGFAWFTISVPAIRQTIWFVPCWAVVLVTAASGYGLMRRRRFAAGLCPTCGYDLRATPQEGGALLTRCPECGTECGTAAPPAATAEAR